MGPAQSAVWYQTPVKGGVMLPETLAEDPALRMALDHAVASAMESAVLGCDAATGRWALLAPEMAFDALLAPLDQRVRVFETTGPGLLVLAHDRTHAINLFIDWAVFGAPARSPTLSFGRLRRTR